MSGGDKNNELRQRKIIPFPCEDLVFDEEEGREREAGPGAGGAGAGLIDGAGDGAMMAGGGGGDDGSTWDGLDVLGIAFADGSGYGGQGSGGCGRGGAGAGDQAFNGLAGAGAGAGAGAAGDECPFNYDQFMEDLSEVDGDSSGSKLQGAEEEEEEKEEEEMVGPGGPAGEDEERPFGRLDIFVIVLLAIMGLLLFKLCYWMDSHIREYFS